MPWDRSNVGFLSLFVCFCVYYPAGGKDDAVVKGPPSPPRYLSRSIVGVAENKYHFSWLASRNTGGLPVNYSVELCVTHVNIKMCKWSMKPECQPRNIRNNQQKFSCLLDGDFFPSYSRQAYDYTLHVWAENELGNASSALFSPVVPYRSVTPLPPLGIRAEALGSNEIYVHWQPRKDWFLIQLEYKIIFHPKDGVNKTKLVLGPQNYTRLTIEDGVEAFLTYYIYVMVRFINGKTKGHFSELHPPVVVKTKAGVPGSPPVVKKHHAQVFPENALLRNVTVEWERSKIAAWRGTPYLYKVECRRHQLLVCSSDVNATLNHTVLHRLNSTDYYNVYIRMCNKQEGCSGLGNSYTISAEDAGVGTESTRKRPNKEFLILILSSGALFVALIIGAGFLWRKQRYSRGAGSLSNLALDPPPPNDYNIVDPDIQHPYDRVDLI